MQNLPELQSVAVLHDAPSGHFISQQLLGPGTSTSQKIPSSPSAHFGPTEQSRVLSDFGASVAARESLFGVGSGSTTSPQPTLRLQPRMRPIMESSEAIRIGCFMLPREQDTCQVAAKRWLGFWLKYNDSQESYVPQGVPRTTNLSESNQFFAFENRLNRALKDQKFCISKSSSIDGWL
jgi:hypothetical protein